MIFSSSCRGGEGGSGGYLHMTGWQYVDIITHPVNINENSQFTQFSHSSILLTFRQLSCHSTGSHAHSLLLNQIIITDFINSISDIRFATLLKSVRRPFPSCHRDFTVWYCQWFSFSTTWILCKNRRFMKYERQLNNVIQRQDLKGRCWYYIIVGSWYSAQSANMASLSDPKRQPSQVLGWQYQECEGK